MNYGISNGWGNVVPVEPVTTSTKYLDEQLKMLGALYNQADVFMTDRQKQDIDALIHWLTEILEKARDDDTVILQVVE